MPTNTELITNLEHAVETIEGRLGPMEANMSHVLSAIERIAKTIERIATPTSKPTVDNSSPHPITSGQVFHHHTTSSDNHAIIPRPPRLDFPTFGGNNVKGWLFQLESFFDLHETPPDHMLSVAPLFMTGEALKLFQWKHTSGQVSSWTQLTRNLRRHFGHSTYYYAGVAINKLIQPTSVASYIATFESMSTKMPGLAGS
ncbi:unnamed protein product [Rhodiola kirilowii]